MVTPLANKMGGTRGDNTIAWDRAMISYLGGGVDRERERARREQRGPAGGGRGGGAQRWAPKSSVLTSLLATDVSLGHSG